MYEQGKAPSSLYAFNQHRRRANLAGPEFTIVVWSSELGKGVRYVGSYQFCQIVRRAWKSNSAIVEYNW